MPLWGRRPSPVVTTPPPATPASEAETRGLFNLHGDTSATAVLLGGTVNYSGETVTEGSTLSLSAVYRAVALISEGIATLPLKTYRDKESGVRERVTSFLDWPAGPDELMTPFEWKERVVLHLLLAGESDLLHIRNKAGALVGLKPVHPSAVTVHADDQVAGGERYTVSLDDGRNLALTPFGTTEADPGMTRILGPRVRGNRGVSPLAHAATSIGIGLAAERATAKMFRDGAMIKGALTPAAGEDLDTEDAESIRDDLNRYVFGGDNAGTIPLINRVLTFNQWQFNNVDSQFLENRQFQIEEISRWLGVPPMLLMQLEKQTSWGTGVSQQNTNFAQQVLRSWSKRMEERLFRLLPQPRWVEFDFAGLLAGAPAEETALLLSEVNGGLRTLNEARRIKNLPPLAGGDELRVPSGVMLQSQLLAAVAAAKAAVPPPAAPAPDVEEDTGGTPNT